MVNVMEKYFKTKYKPAGILLNANTKMCFGLKVKLKFIHNKY